MHSLLVDQLTAALGPGYAIERELGGGGMSRVFVAFEEALQRRVAVKVLPEHLAASVSVDRFKREILLSAGLQHPHIVGVLSAGEAAGLPFFVMPYVEGESLGTRLATKGAMSVRETVSVLKDVARALAYAHERGVVHRDIKPANLLLDERGRLGIGDFGIARVAETSAAQQLTATGQVLGTAAYISPEQAVGDGATAASDRYALAVVAYELLTGGKLFPAEHPAAQARAHVETPPPRPSELAPELSPAVDRVLWRNPVAFYGLSGRLNLDITAMEATHEGNSILRGGA